MVIIYKLFSSNLLKNSALYVIADGLNRAIPFLLLPIIVRYLTPEDYGIVTNYAVLIQIMGVFVFGAAQGSIPVNYFKMSKQEFQGYLVSIFSLALLVSFVFLVLVVISHVYIEDLLFKHVINRIYYIE